MKIVFTSKGTNWESQIDPRFGRTEYFLIYDEQKDEIIPIDNSGIAEEAHGAGPKAAKTIFDNGATILITGNGPGGNAETILKKTGISVFVGAGGSTVKEAYEKYQKGKLNKL